MLIGINSGRAVRAKGTVVFSEAVRREITDKGKKQSLVVYECTP